METPYLQNKRTLTEIFFTAKPQKEYIATLLSQSAVFDLTTSDFMTCTVALGNGVKTGITSLLRCAYGWTGMGERRKSGESTSRRGLEQQGQQLTLLGAVFLSGNSPVRFVGLSNRCSCCQTIATHSAKENAADSFLRSHL